jgi:hypothetical protein
LPSRASPATPRETAQVRGKHQCSDLDEHSGHKAQNICCTRDMVVVRSMALGALFLMLVTAGFLVLDLYT